jgi:Tfp pilus assembly protein PilN
MIEINLLPGSTKRAARRGLPRLGLASGASKLRLPPVDRTLAMIVGAWIVALGLVGWLHLTTGARITTLRADVQAAVRDSTRYATLRAQGDSLKAQEGVIAQKMEVIQAIDAGRYVWPHILDEVSQALPPYIWLTHITESASTGALPRFRLQGKAGNTFALTRFMDELEASPFLHAVRLISSVQERLDTRTVHDFVLEVGFSEPPPDAIQTVPLFGAITREN